MAGGSTLLVYAVTPDDHATTVTVAVTPGADWAVTAVLGAGAPNEAPLSQAAVAELIARRGVVAATAQLTVMQGPGCTLEWKQAEPPAPPTPPPAPPTIGRPKKAASKRTSRSAR